MKILSLPCFSLPSKVFFLKKNIYISEVFLDYNLVLMEVTVGGRSNEKERWEINDC